MNTDYQRVCIIIPALNEEKAIKQVIDEIPNNFDEHIYVVNNGSTDQTERVAQKAGAIVLNAHQKGYGFACLKGIEYAKSKGAEIIVFMDGDHSDYPQEIFKLLTPIYENNMDFVVGSRVLGQREKGSLTPQQRFGNALATRLIKLVYGGNFTDLGPFRAIKTNALNSLNMQDKTYGWTIEMQIKAVKKGLNYTEVPVNYRNRIGQSKVSGTIKGSVMAGIKILFAILKYRF